MNKNVLAIGVIFFLIVSTVTPMTLGYNNITFNKVTKTNNCNFDKYLYPEYYDCYNIDEIPDFIEQPNSDTYTDYSNSDSVVSNQKEIIKPLDGPMDSPWPMYCHDIRHTGRSLYSTSDNSGNEKWRFGLSHEIYGGISIDNNGNIYFGSDGLYVVYPNGTLKWKYITYYKVHGTPSIDENGIIYFGCAYGDYLYALYPNGTLKWNYFVGDSIFSSPVIDANGSIYFGSEDDYIYALYSNGTLKWKYLTGVAVYSSPAIGNDGTVYCGSHDTYLYALYPNNGTLKWKYQTGDWVGRGPSIADDGTIYFGSWDGYLYAVYPDGSLKWKINGHLAGTTPVTAQDGTIYVGNRYLSAIYPSNGSVKWTFDPGSDRTIRGGNPCISAEGIIYFGTHIGETGGGELIAVNPDGTERWRIMLATTWIWSAPAIGEDGTIYIGSCNDESPWGYLHAIGPPDPSAPSAPQINGQTSIKPRRSYEYTFKSTSPVGRNVYYYIDWGDNTVKDWFGPFGSGEEVKVSHTWFKRGTYIIKARAKDTDNLWGSWGELKVTTLKNKAINLNLIFIKLLEQFPLLQKLLIF